MVKNDYELNAADGGPVKKHVQQQLKWLQRKLINKLNLKYLNWPGTLK